MKKTDNLNSLILIKAIKFVLKISIKKTPGSDGFVGELLHHGTLDTLQSPQRPQKQGSIGV